MLCRLLYRLGRWVSRSTRCCRLRRQPAHLSLRRLRQLHLYLLHLCLHPTRQETLPCR